MNVRSVPGPVLKPVDIELNKSARQSLRKEIKKNQTDLGWALQCNLRQELSSPICKLGNYIGVYSMVLLGKLSEIIRCLA